MTPEQRAYIDSRRRQIRYWPWMAVVLVTLVVAGYGWLWQNAQVNLNPQLVLEQFSTRVLTDEELILLAARGTLALAACGLFMLLLVVMVSVALWNEHRLIRMLEDLDGAAGPDEAGAHHQAGEGAFVAEGTAGEAAAVADPGGSAAGDDAERPESASPAAGPGGGSEAGSPR